MKSIYAYFFLLFTGFILVSCGSTTTKELVSEAADKSASVKVSGTRMTSFDPFQTSIVINGYGQSDTLVTEIFAKDLNDEAVKFEWADNSNCKVTFTQTDNSKKILEVKFGEPRNAHRLMESE